MAQESQEASLAPLDLDERLGTFVTRDELAEQIDKLSWKKGDFKFTPYGILWINAAYDSQATAPGEFSLYSQSRDICEEPYYAVDARTSRIGMFIDGPKISAFPNANLKGVFEVDFQGPINSSRNKGGLQLRKAFVELNDKVSQTRVMFGQDWEVISPLYPQMLAYLPGGFAGNIGYRRAQLRLEKGIDISENFKTLYQVALADDFTCDYAANQAVTAKPSGLPLIEGRYAISLFEKARCGLPITVGISGHYGEESFTFGPLAGSFQNTTDKNKKIKTWSANLDVDVPITKNIRLQGECYYGENLNTFCGAINQGVDLFHREGIRDLGGWLCIHTNFTDKLANNIGYCTDTPDLDTVIGTTAPSNGITYARTRNTVWFTNFLYNWNPAFMTGIEFTFWETDYRRADVSTAEPVFLPMAKGETYRTEFVVKYTF